jgi:hypothetical protein
VYVLCLGATKDKGDKGLPYINRVSRNTLSHERNGKDDLMMRLGACCQRCSPSFAGNVAPQSTRWVKDQACGITKNGRMRSLLILGYSLDQRPINWRANADDETTD